MSQVVSKEGVAMPDYGAKAHRGKGTQLLFLSIAVPDIILESLDHIAQS